MTLEAILMWRARFPRLSKPLQRALVVVSVLGCLAAATSACEKKTQTKEPPAWVGQVEISATSSRRIFDDNIELFVTLQNNTSEALTLSELHRDGEVRMRLDGDSSTVLHPISVGVAKPILLAPKQALQTSLLFKAARGTPRELLVYDKMYPIASR